MLETIKIEIECIIRNCNSNAIDKKLPFIAKSTYEGGFVVCQKHWNEIEHHNFLKMVKKFHNNVLKFQQEWDTIVIDKVIGTLEEIHD